MSEEICAKLLTVPDLSGKSLISIHAPLRERETSNIKADTALKFQSTLPYGSDYGSFLMLEVLFYFNPRSLTGANLPCGQCIGCRLISIHAPLRERINAQQVQSLELYFNPRSLTGANLPCGQCIGCRLISIHAPLRERINAQQVQSLELYFNPRSLTGATRSVARCTGAVPFQSTLPYGSDSSTTITIDSAVNFNPRSLTGARD